MKRKKIQARNFFIFFCLTLSFIVTNIGQAFALKIIPPRLVIRPDTKVEYMFIKNNSDQTETYRLGWKHIAMDKEGNVLNLDKLGRDRVPEYRAADDLIRFSPRRATLEPGETQRVTFMLRRSPNLEPGEYRSHFFVKREPRVPVKDASENLEKDTENQQASEPLTSPSISIDVLVSRSVPIYVLNGETEASLSLLKAELKKNPNRKKKTQPEHHVHFDVQKTGNRSIIGQANVFCTINGEDTRVNKVTRTFAVYAEGEFRKEKMAVEVPAGGCPNMKIVINGHPNDVLAGQILGELVVTR